LIGGKQGLLTFRFKKELNSESLAIIKTEINYIVLNDYRSQFALPIQKSIAKALVDFSFLEPC